MAQYLLSVWHEDDYDLDFESDVARRRMAKVDAFNADLQATGAFVYANGLHPAAMASVARPTDEGVMLTDGPYAGTEKQMGGFWIVNAPDLEAAKELARRGAAACEQPVEVRPMHGG